MCKLIIILLISLFSFDCILTKNTANGIHLEAEEKHEFILSKYTHLLRNSDYIFLTNEKDLCIIFIYRDSCFLEYCMHVDFDEENIISESKLKVDSCCLGKALFDKNNYHQGYFEADSPVFTFFGSWL